MDTRLLVLILEFKHILINSWTDENDLGFATAHLEVEFDLIHVK